MDDDPGDARPQTAERGAGLSRLRGLALDLTPLRVSRPFRNLLIGDAVSVVGTQITTVAVPLQVYEQTQPAFAVGLVASPGSCR